MGEGIDRDEYSRNLTNWNVDFWHPVPIGEAAIQHLHLISRKFAEFAERL